MFAITQRVARRNTSRLGSSEATQSPNPDPGPRMRRSVPHEMATFFQIIGIIASITTIAWFAGVGIRQIYESVVAGLIVQARWELAIDPTRPAESFFGAPSQSDYANLTIGCTGTKSRFCRG